MKQIFHPYTKWECYKNGLWRKETSEYEDLQLPIAIEFTGNHILYGKAMKRIIEEWPNSCENFLSNISINRRAWLGHAAVCIEFGIPEYITRIAWWELTEQQRIDADLQATNTIRLWESKRKPKTIFSIGSPNVIQMGYLMKPPMN